MLDLYDTAWSQELCSKGNDDCKECCDVVASQSLFAGLFKEISVKYPELAALVPEISKVAWAAVATAKSTATPAGTWRALGEFPRQSSCYVRLGDLARAWCVLLSSCAQLASCVFRIWCAWNSDSWPQFCSHRQRIPGS